MDLSRFVVDAVVLDDFPRVCVASRPRKTPARRVLLDERKEFVKCRAHGVKDALKSAFSGSVGVMPDS